MNESLEKNKIIEILALHASWLVPLCVYTATIAPVVTAGDSGEFVVSVNKFSLPHPPGYPLYLLLLKLWTLIPINIGPDQFAVRTNLFSVICMTVMCAFFYRLLSLLTGSPAASLAAVLLLAFSRTLWKFAVITEVHALNLLLVVLLLYGLALAQIQKNPRGLVLASFAFGLGLAHHHSIIFLLPLMIALFPRGHDSVKIPKGVVLSGIILPLLLYLLLPIMAANTPKYSESGFGIKEFIKTVTKAEYRASANRKSETETLIQPKHIIQRTIKYLGRQFGWLLLALGIIGWFYAPRDLRKWSIWIFITFLIWIAGVTFFSKGHPLGMPMTLLRTVDELLLPLNLFFAIGIAWLLALASIKLASTTDISGTEGQNFIPPKLIPLTITLLFCILPLFLGFINYRYSSMSHHTFAQDQARNVLTQVPKDGVLIVSREESYLYEYLQTIRGLRPDVSLHVYPFNLVIEGIPQPAPNSLAYFIDNELGDRACMFSFSPPATILPYLKKPRALRLDGIAYTLIDAEPEKDDFSVGDPSVWLQYQLRNLDPATMVSIVPDDFEYEVFDRYINGLKAAVAWLDQSGYGNDPSKREFTDMYMTLEKVIANIDNPYMPSAVQTSKTNLSPEETE